LGDQLEAYAEAVDFGKRPASTRGQAALAVAGC
jgi:hypothetical protein